MNALEPLLPVLQTLGPLGFPAASLQGWYAYANQKQAERLAKSLKYEIDLVNQRLSTRVNHFYLASEGFRANVIQALRAAEVAESEEKIKIIAKSLTGCLLAIDAEINRTQCLRIVEAITIQETLVLKYIVAPLPQHEIPDSQIYYKMNQADIDITPKAVKAACFGLRQLGLIDMGGTVYVPDPDQSDMLCRPTILARHVVALCTATEVS